MTFVNGACESQFSGATLNDLSFSRGGGGTLSGACQSASRRHYEEFRGYASDRRFAGLEFLHVVAKIPHTGIPQPITSVCKTYVGFNPGEILTKTGCVDKF
jgi:hypothetical protein